MLLSSIVSTTLLGALGGKRLMTCCSALMIINGDSSKWFTSVCVIVLDLICAALHAASCGQRAAWIRFSTGAEKSWGNGQSVICLVK